MAGKWLINQKMLKQIYNLEMLLWQIPQSNIRGESQYLSLKMKPIRSCNPIRRLYEDFR